MTTHSVGQPQVVEAPHRQRRHRALTIVLVSVGALAVVVRLLLLMRGGGFGGIVGYDDGVYYGAATALVSGRLPYREFVLLHPPGILAVLTPFALLGHLTHDRWGFEAARLGWMLIGGLNAALVAWTVRRRGLAAAACGGLFYACWTPVALTEVTTRLEPLVSLGLLVALALLSRPRAEITTRILVLAGLALGFSATVKIWAAAPVVVLVWWCWHRGGRPAAIRVLLGVAAAATAICLPFFLAAPGAMFRMVVLDQLGRGRTSRTTLQRVASVLGLKVHGVHGGVWLAVIVALILVVLVVAAARSGRAGRFVVTLLLVQLGVLLASPSYFSYYAAFVGPALALAVAYGVSALVESHRRSPARLSRWASAPGTPVLVVLLVLAVVGLVRNDAVSDTGRRYPGSTIQETVENGRCVTSDSPDALALANVLSRDLDRGCPLMVDVTGLTYDKDAGTRLPDGHRMTRVDNPKWQRDLMHYLLAGDSIVLTRTHSDGFSPTSNALLNQRRVLDSGGSFVLLGGPFFTR